MLRIINYLKTIPLGLLIVLSIVTLLLFTILLTKILFHFRFKKQINKALKKYSNKRELEDYLKTIFSKKIYYKKSKTIEKIAITGNTEIITLTHIDDIWIENLLKRSKEADLKRILNYCHNKGLFSCFLVSLNKPKLASVLETWINNNPELMVIRKIGLSGKGELFNGYSGLKLLNGKLPEIRELSGDPEWESRYFAVKILMYDSDKKSERAIWETLQDSHPLIRRVIIEEFQPKELDIFENKLMTLFLNDSIRDVRVAAKKRILTDFPGSYKIEFDKLTEIQKYHVVEHFSPELEEDKHAALRFLAGDNLELRLPSALFLNDCGVLHRLLREANTEDREDLNRKLELLQKSSEVSATAFLKALEDAENVGSLLIATKILQTSGNSELIHSLGVKVFNSELYNLNEELYEEVVKCISMRGDNRSIRVLSNELKRNKANNLKAAAILKHLPKQLDFVFFNTIKDILLNPEFPLKEELKNAFLGMDRSLYFPILFDILKAETTKYDYRLKTVALKILAELKETYCLQIMLENLYVLTIDDSRDFAKLLSSYGGEEFIQKTKNLLASNDSKSRARLITSLPATGKKVFLDDIKVLLKDVDADVRIACVWALVDYDETKTLSLAFPLLSDPVEKVRKEAAKAIGQKAGEPGLNEIQKILQDKNEVKAVKAACIEGLVSSKSLKVIDILIQKFEDDDVDEELSDALSFKTKKEELKKIIEKFKDANADVRKKICYSFKIMGVKGESAIVGLLAGKSASLKPYIAEILDSTGYIESQVRKLTNRNVQTRRDAAAFLSMIETMSAYRGLVLAVKDPDSDVRTHIVKALEKLNTKPGTQILEELENDSNKRIRKYIYWALERIKAKNL